MASKELSILLLAKDMASKTIGKVSKQVGGLGKMGATASRGIKMLGVSLAALGTAAVIGIGAAVKTGIAELAKSEAAAAQTAAVIKSTGGIAHVTAADIDELTASLQAKTATEDDAVRAGANMMLTFTNVRNEAGKGNDIFDRSIATLADMSRAMGGDMSKSAIQLGKALNDPIKGVGALSKVGVTFTEEQKKRIKGFVEEGKVAKAQAIILAELNKEFGGSGAAYAKTYAGTMESLGFAVEDAQKSLAVGFMPVIKKVAAFLQTQLAKPAVIQGIKDLGEGLAGAFEGAMDFAMSIPWDSVMATGRSIAGFAKQALDFFKQMPDWAQKILIGGAVINFATGGALGDIVKQLASGMIKGVLGITAGIVNVTGPVAGLPGGLGGGKGGIPAVGGGSLLATLGAAGITAAAVAAAAWTIFKVTEAAFNPPGGGHDPTIAENKNPANVQAAVWSSIAHNLDLVTHEPAKGSGRGDTATAKEVKRLGDIQALAARIVAAGGRATAARIEAIMAKNVRATESGDTRVAGRIDSMTAAVRAIKIAPVINVSTYPQVTIRNVSIANRIASAVDVRTGRGNAKIYEGRP